MITNSNHCLPYGGELLRPFLLIVGVLLLCGSSWAAPAFNPCNNLAFSQRYEFCLHDSDSTESHYSLRDFLWCHRHPDHHGYLQPCPDSLGFDYMVGYEP